MRVCVCVLTVTMVTLLLVQAPEFVRKHILNKHGEKVATVRQEVEFFNNFLLDAKRPALPENKPLPPPTQGDSLTQAFWETWHLTDSCVKCVR